MAEEDSIFDLENEGDGGDSGFAPLDYTISGEVLRIVFTSGDTGYSVIRLRDGEGKDNVVVGFMPNILEGQEIEAKGRWELHPEHGRQFKVSSYEEVMPSTKEGIKDFLSSGTIKGVGKKTAAAIVSRFGEDTFDIIEKHPERLKEVPGIGEAEAAAAA